MKESLQDESHFGQLGLEMVAKKQDDNGKKVNNHFKMYFLYIKIAIFPLLTGHDRWSFPPWSWSLDPWNQWISSPPIPQLGKKKTQLVDDFGF